MTDQSLANKNTLDNKLILVGVIRGAHGIKGQIIVKSYTDPFENIVKLPVFDKENKPISLKITRIRPDGNLICSIKGCDSRTAAETLAKKAIYCLRSDLPEINEEDEFYIEDLIGLKLVDVKGNHIGKILNVANYGGGDIVEVKFINEKDSELVPFSKELFPEINKDKAVWGGEVKTSPSP
jgi:16S rRNA processing protein RimM